MIPYQPANLRKTLFSNKAVFQDSSRSFRDLQAEFPQGHPKLLADSHWSPRPTILSDLTLSGTLSPRSRLVAPCDRTIPLFFTLCVHPEFFKPPGPSQFLDLRISIKFSLVSQWEAEPNSC